MVSVLLISKVSSDSNTVGYLIFFLSTRFLLGLKIFVCSWKVMFADSLYLWITQFLSPHSHITHTNNVDVDNVDDDIQIHVSYLLFP